MAELAAARHSRWFRLCLPVGCRARHLWAERFFSTRAAAFDYSERRRAEHPSGRLHSPVPDREGDGAWAVSTDTV